MCFVLQFWALCVVAGELNSDPDVWQGLSLTNDSSVLYKSSKCGAFNQRDSPFPLV